MDLVIQIAWNGRVEQGPYKTCIASLFQLNPQNYEDVYENAQQLRLGLEVLRATFNQRGDAHTLERTQYSVMLMYLENKLGKAPHTIENVKEGIQHAALQLKHFELTHTNVISNLADIYRQYISPLGPKVIVKGEESILRNPDNASRIRALLLAGIRASLLWRQAGGSRWRLLFERKTMAKEIDAILPQNS